jgi:hypothetical protein
MAVIDWSCTGIRVPSIIQGPDAAGRIGLSRLDQHRHHVIDDVASVDWLVPNSAASAQVVRLVRK